MKPMIHCRHFSGYKPCGLNKLCDKSCPSMEVPLTRILIVHLGALGAVIRATSLLRAIKKKYPKCHITWVTEKPCDQLLLNNPHIDRVLLSTTSDLLALRCLKFDVAFCIDKSLTAAGILKSTKIDFIYGFNSTEGGAIVPANPEAQELWELGLDNHKKFFINKKPETQLMIEALNLGHYRADSYILSLTGEEQSLAKDRREIWKEDRSFLVGLNTGCAPTIKYKKLSVSQHRDLITRLNIYPEIKVVLLGGPEDTERNNSIARGLNVVNSPTQLGLRDGICSVEACDVVVSGDSLGMHLGIALQKWVVAWFGPTCAHEIELYSRGVKVNSQIGCSPCWKRSCQNTPMCYEMVNLDDIVSGVLKGLSWARKSSLYKPHLSETPF